MPIYHNKTAPAGDLFDTHIDDSLFRAVLTADLNFTTSNTTLQNITGLSFPISASPNEIWQIEIYLEMTAANATMDAKFGWATMPTSATMRWGVIGDVPAVVSAVNIPGYSAAVAAGTSLAIAIHTDAITVATGAFTSGVMFAGKVYGGGTAGTIQFQGSQATSDGGQLTALKGSSLIAQKLVR